MDSGDIQTNEDLQLLLLEASSNIFNFEDIDYFASICNCDPEVHRSIDIFNRLTTDRERFFFLLNYCFRNPLFAAKWLVGVDALPFQGALLKTLWDHRFVFWLGTRGAGKCVTSDTLLMTSSGFKTIGDILNKPKGLYADNGEFNQVAYVWNKEPEVLVRIETEDGYTLTGTFDHPIAVVRNGVREHIVMGDLKVGDEALLFVGKQWAISPIFVSKNYVKKLAENIVKHKELSPDIYKIKKDKLIYLSSLLKEITFKRITDAIHWQAMLLFAGIRSIRKDNYVYVVDPVSTIDIKDRIVKITSDYRETYDVYIPSYHYFWSNGFMSHNSFLFALYASLRAILIPESKIILVSGSFRQAKQIFDYISSFWDNWHIFQQIAPEGPKRGTDMCRLNIGKSRIYAVPLGGDTIRGLRSNVTLCDEISYIPDDILKTVIMGFSAVSMSPNERVKKTALQKINKQENNLSNVLLANQLIFAGTGSFSFNHANDYYKTYKAIIQSEGDPEKLSDIGTTVLSQDEIKAFNHKDFAVVTLPYDRLPEGFLDTAIIANSKMSMAPEIFEMEYGAKFVDDTQGFIPMSLIHNRTSGYVMLGSKDNCVMGVDIARSDANFAIVIGVIDDNKNLKIIYVWSFNEKRLQSEFDISDLPQLSYDALCALKILHLALKFNVQRIVMDAGGGGASIKDILANPTLHGITPSLVDLSIILSEDLLPGEELPYNKKALLRLVSFNNDIVVQNNYAMKRDIQAGVMTFSESYLDSNLYIDARYKFLEDCYDLLNAENEYMKREISIVKPIQTSRSVTFDTGTGGHKPKKDRYSACLMAYMAYLDYKDNILTDTVEETYDVNGAIV